MNLSKKKIKYIQSLKDKKYRTEHNTFVAEGHKMVSELLTYIPCQLLVATSSFLKDYNHIDAEEIVEVTESELAKTSFLRTPQQVLGVFYQPKPRVLPTADKELILALDGIQDPGNMGTIMRIADWYGIKNMVCSTDSVDIFNPKTVQATMGAIARVNVFYYDLESFLKDNREVAIYGTLLNGEDMYSQQLTRNGIIVMGNEGKGIRPNIEKLISNRLFIPNYPRDSQTSESLNVAIATAIICAEFRRRSH